MSTAHKCQGWAGVGQTGMQVDMQAVPGQVCREPKSRAGWAQAPGDTQEPVGTLEADSDRKDHEGSEGH